MNETTLSDVTIELKRGDIANQADVEAVVNAANAELRIGGGVAGAIHKAAGHGLTEETRPMAPIKPGEAVISGGRILHPVSWNLFRYSAISQDLITNSYELSKFLY